MRAERLLIETDDQGKPIRLPQLPPNCRMEAILLYPEQPAAPVCRRYPSSAISGKGRILGDIVAPIIPESDWDASMIALDPRISNKRRPVPMKNITFQECSEHFPRIFERIFQDHAVITVRKTPDQSIVMLDAREYGSLVETLHLLSNPANAQRMREGIEQHMKGRIREIDVAAYLD